MLGLFVNLQWQQSRIGKQIINVAQVVFTGELIVAIMAYISFAVVFHADYDRHYAWESVVAACVVLRPGATTTASDPAHRKFDPRW